MYRSLPVAPIFIQVNPVHNLMMNLFEIRFSIFYLHLHFPNDSFRSSLSIKSLCCNMDIAKIANLIILDVTTLIIFGLGKIIKLLTQVKGKYVPVSIT